MSALVGPHGLVALAVLAAPLAIGAAHPTTRVALSAVIALALLWGLVIMGRRLRFDALAYGLLVALLWTVVQWLPLPSGLVESLGSPSPALNAQATAALGSEAGTSAISVDRASTADMILYLFTALGAYLIALNTRPARRRQLVQVVALAGLLVVAIGLAHKALHAKVLFGFYAPNVPLAQLPLPTSLINNNHAAAMLILGAAAAAGLAMTTDNKKALPGYWAIALACGGGVVLTRSIAGMALLGGVAAAVLLRRWLVNLGITPGRRRALIFAVPLLVVAAAYGVVEVSEVAVADRWAIGWEVAREHLSVGVGAGAFPMVSSQVQPDWVLGHLTYAHNGFLEAIAAWGLPASIVIVGFLGWGVAATLWRTRSEEHFLLAVLAVVAVVTANVVEFSLWLPGVGMPALMLFAWASGEAQRKRTRVRTRSRKKASLTAVESDLADAEEEADSEEVEDEVEADAVTPKKKRKIRKKVVTPVHIGPAWRIAAAAALAALLPLAQQVLRANSHTTHAQARHHVTKADVAATVALASAHPGDYYLWLHAAKAAAAKKDARLQGLVNHALRLAPKHPETLQLCGLHSPDDASLKCLEGLVAAHLKLGFKAARVAMARTAAGSKGFTERFAASSPKAAMAVVDTLRVGQGQEAHEESLRWALRQHPGDPVVTGRLVQLWLDKPHRQVELNALSLTLFGRAETVEDPARKAELRRLAYLSMGAVTVNVDRDPRSAAHAFEAAAREIPEKAHLPRTRAASAWLAAGEPKRAAALVNKLETASKKKRAGRKQKAAIYALKSRVAEAEGDLDGAISELRRAMAFDARSATLHGRLAQLFHKSGAEQLAQKAIDKARELGGNPPALPDPVRATPLP